MPAAPRSRPPRHVVLHSLSGHVKARPRAVFEALDRRFKPAEDATSLYTSDAAAFFIISQSRWWYRGEYRVVPDEWGSHIDHYMVNVAQRGRGLAAFAGRSAIRSARADFERLMRELRAELE